MKSIDVGFRFGKKHYQFVDRVQQRTTMGTGSISSMEPEEFRNAELFENCSPLVSAFFRLFSALASLLADRKTTTA
jgi:hypothetical protein